MLAVIALGRLEADAQTNIWTNSSSDTWDDVSSWSLGVLPGSSQSVVITNSGGKSVAINPSTPGNFPGSMTVSSLTILGSTNTENVLLLNYFGTNIPLTVLNGITLQDDGQILNLDSALVVQSGTFLVTNSQMIQDGGLVCATNAQMRLSEAEYDITNGVFEGGLVWIGVPFPSTFNQYGGTVLITNLSLGPENAPNNPHGGAYALYGGNLSLPGGLALVGYPNNRASYLQEGGTNQTTEVYVSPESSSSFTLNGGLLTDNNVEVISDTFGPAAIVQNGGSHVITNTLVIVGGAANGYTVLPATYSLNGGTLSADGIELGADEGDSVFVQSNATTCAGTVYAHSVGYYSSHNTIVTLSGGTLSCSNYTTDDGGGSLNQSAGALVVSNLLDFGGFREVAPNYHIYGAYTFTGGTVTASNISITGDWIIGDGSTNRISNPGFFSLAHLLRIGNAVEQLGQFILATNATIDLAGSASRLSFANSSGQIWAGGATLVIADWNGNPSGGGAEQLSFGTDQSGLTPAQLSQIQFQIGTNFYSAKILDTGEVAPGSASAPPPPQLVNNWANPMSAKWEDPYWSLGILPGSNQTVNITNDGYKAVNIDSATFTNYPASLTVSNLVVAAPTHGLGSLLLNYAGLGTPLKVLNSCTIGANGTIDNFSSSFEVDGNAGGQLLVDGGTFTQNGGLTVVNGPVSVLSGAVNATNGDLTLGPVTLGAGSEPSDPYNPVAVFTQDGGSIATQSIDIEQGGDYHMASGVLYAINGTTCSAGTFMQYGGTNYGNVTLTGDYYALFSGLVQGETLTVANDNNFQQEGGLLDMQFINVTGNSNYPPDLAPRFIGGVVHCGTLNIGNNARVELRGADFFLTNNFRLQGMAFIVGDVGLVVEHADCVLAAGHFHLPSMTLGPYASFDESGGTNEISGGLSITGTYWLGQGTLETTSTGVGAAATFTHLGGNHFVAGVLSITGPYNQSGGNVACEGLYLRGALTMTVTYMGMPPPPAGTFTNTGLLDLGGTITTELPDFEAGQVELATNATIAFSNGFPAIVHFDNSSGVAWTSGALLVITNWSNSDHVFAGTDSSGLNASQLQQIHFANPSGSPPGNYSAQLLSTGEVVPAPLPTLQSAVIGSALMLTWSSGWSLQSATNLPGPYSDIPSATSPYTNDMTLEAQQFFRLRLGTE